MIEPSLWSKLHGASTHFPIALILVSAFCDTVRFLSRDDEFRRKLRFAGTLSLALGAVGSYGAVLSGLIIAHWQIWGHETLLRHHQFVWPAFALMTGLAAWRAFTPAKVSPRADAIYLSLLLIAAAVMSGAGYWGGELFSEG